MAPNSERLLFTVPETAELLGISENHTWNLVHRGELPSIKLGHLRRVPRAALEEWIAKQCTGAAPGVRPIGAVR